jgi:hypothetical protein
MAVVEPPDEAGRPQDNLEPPAADADFERQFGEPLRRVLDLDTWHPGSDIPALYERLDREIRSAVEQEDRVVGGLRAAVVPRIKDRSRKGAPPLAGVWNVSLETLEKVHRTTLFAGEVEACDGTVLVHDSLALTIIQLGVCLISYNGDEGTWSHRLFRRDLRGAPDDPVDEALELLELRDRRASVGVDDRRDRLTELGRRGIMTYAERAVLTRLSTAPWRLGQGSPAPFELLTGAGALDLVERGLDVLSELLLDHRRFVFVPSAPRLRALLTIGLALRPLEFAVVHRLRSYIEDIVKDGHLRGRRLRAAVDFVDAAGEAVAVGVYRVSRTAPPYVFYAPADPELCAQAAAIVMADAVLQEHRGFPLLLDMADQFCAANFGRQDFLGTVGAAYAAQDRAFADLSERETRPYAGR